jgi:hypothetical protein
MIEAGLPPGILNVVNGDKETVDAILDDPDVKAISFVGSTPVAEYIYARGAATTDSEGPTPRRILFAASVAVVRARVGLVVAKFQDGAKHCVQTSYPGPPADPCPNRGDALDGADNAPGFEIDPLSSHHLLLSQVRRRGHAEEMIAVDEIDPGRGHERFGVNGPRSYSTRLGITTRE